MGNILTGAMQLHRGQAEFLGDFGVLNLAGILKRHSSNEFSHVGGGGNCRTAAKGLEFGLFDDSVLVDTDLQLHYVPAATKKNENIRYILYVIL